MANLKDELNKIVDDLSKIKPNAVGADDPITDTNWNNVVNSITTLTEAIGKINSVSPSLPLVGFKYKRYPGEKLPWDLYPATQESDWTLIHEMYPGAVWRLAGGNASKFKEDSTSVSYDEKTKGDGGAQKDSLQEHEHNYSYAYQGSGGVAWGIYKIGHVLQSTKSTGKNTGRKDIETRMINVTYEEYEYRADLNKN